MDSNNTQTTNGSEQTASSSSQTSAPTSPPSLYTFTGIASGLSAKSQHRFATIYLFSTSERRFSGVALPKKIPDAETLMYSLYELCAQMAPLEQSNKIEIDRLKQCIAKLTNVDEEAVTLSNLPDDTTLEQLEERIEHVFQETLKLEEADLAEHIMALNRELEKTPEKSATLLFYRAMARLNYVRNRGKASQATSIDILNLDEDLFRLLNSFHPGVQLKDSTRISLQSALDFIFTELNNSLIDMSRQNTPNEIAISMALNYSQITEKMLLVVNNKPRLMLKILSVFIALLPDGYDPSSQNPILTSIKYIDEILTPLLIEQPEMFHQHRKRMDTLHEILQLKKIYSELSIASKKLTGQLKKNRIKLVDLRKSLNNLVQYLSSELCEPVDTQLMEIYTHIFSKAASLVSSEQWRSLISCVTHQIDHMKQQETSVDSRLIPHLEDLQQKLISMKGLDNLKDDKSGKNNSKRSKRQGTKKSHTPIKAKNIPVKNNKMTSETVSKAATPSATERADLTQLDAVIDEVLETTPQSEYPLTNELVAEELTPLIEQSSEDLVLQESDEETTLITEVIAPELVQEAIQPDEDSLPVVEVFAPEIVQETVQPNIEPVSVAEVLKSEVVQATIQPDIELATSIQAPQTSVSKTNNHLEKSRFFSSSQHASLMLRPGKFTENLDQWFHELKQISSEIHGIYTTLKHMQSLQDHYAFTMSHSSAFDKESWNLVNYYLHHSAKNNSEIQTRILAPRLEALKHSFENHYQNLVNWLSLQTQGTFAPKLHSPAVDPELYKAAIRAYTRAYNEFKKNPQPERSRIIRHDLNQLMQIEQNLSLLSEDPVLILVALKIASCYSLELSDELKQFLHNEGHYYLQEAQVQNEGVIMDYAWNAFSKGNALNYYKTLCQYGYNAILFPVAAHAGSHYTPYIHKQLVVTDALPEHERDRVYLFQQVLLATSATNNSPSPS